jgi:hypothetical protein
MEISYELFFVSQKIYGGCLVRLQEHYTRLHEGLEKKLLKFKEIIVGEPYSPEIKDAAT